MDETVPTSTYCIQNAVPYCVGGPIPPQDFNSRCGKLPQDKDARRAPVLPRLVLHGDWHRQGSCSSAHGDSTAVQRKRRGQHTEKQHEPHTFFPILLFL